MIKKGVIALLVILLHSTASFANLDSESHDGLMLRVQLGIGALSSQSDNVPASGSGTTDQKITGAASSGSFQIGYAYWENIIFFSAFSVYTASNPGAEKDGETISPLYNNLTVYEYGAGICYYIMPENIYATLSLNIAQADLEIGHVSQSSDYGLGVTISFGKEIWVADYLGLGIAGIFHYSSMGVEGTYDVKNYFLGIAFSATYN